MIARTAVAVLESIFCRPTFPNIPTKAAQTAESIANSNQDKRIPPLYVLCLVKQILLFYRKICKNVSSYIYALFPFL